MSTNSEPFIERMAKKVTKISGSSTAIVIAFLLIIVWAATGPFLDFSETWQLVINTSTTIITFLMVFLIQNTQNKDSMALQLKLNELIAATEKASNRLIDIEDLSEKELDTLQRYYCHLSEMVKKDKSLQQTHSIEDAKVEGSDEDESAEKRKKQ